MIDPRATTTYAQYNEDITLAALLHDVKKGFYIDVGANYPVIDSVTKYFYEKGWTGINVEPIKNLHEQLQQERPKDINLQCGLGEKEGTITFREYPKLPGHSTFDSTQQDLHNEAYVDYEVPVITTSQLYKKYKPKTVDFMKIDVEGYEYEVIAGNDWDKNRPKIICIEANHVERAWKRILTKHRYKLFIADGLNEYYIAEEEWQRTEGFADRVVDLDYRALKQHQSQSWSADSEALVSVTQKLEEVTNQLRQQVGFNELYKLQSLKGKSYLKRLRIAANGLTIDWLQSLKKPKTKK